MQSKALTIIPNTYPTPSVKHHPQYEAAKALLQDGHSTRFVSDKLKIPRLTVCEMNRTIAARGNK